MNEENGVLDTVVITSPAAKDTAMGAQIDHKKQRYPHCVVWTPIPLLTWFFPLIGHMGIGMSNGVIRDFAGPYFVSEDNMAFGKPTRYWQLDVNKVLGGQSGWDQAVTHASEEYKNRVHNLLCDNCHSHVAYALNLMNYGGHNNWNMFKLAFYSLFLSKSVSFWAMLKTWVPFFIVCSTMVALYFVCVNHVH